MKNNQKNSRPFMLRELISTQTWLWILAWFLGLLTVWSVLGLSMVSGWFVTMSAVAGLVAVGSHTFNYLAPAAIIRTFAIVRTLSRYGDLMVSHHAVFGLLKDLRVRFFGQWVGLDFIERNQQGQSSSQKMHRLVKDIDVLDEFILRLVTPWVMAIGAVAMLAVGLWFLPKGWLGLLPIIFALIVAVLTLRFGTALARQESHLLETRKSKLLDVLPALTSLLIWQRWQHHIDQLEQLDSEQVALTLSSHKLRRVSMLIIQLSMAVAVVVVLVLAWLVFSSADVMPFLPDTLNEYTVFSSAVVLAVVLVLAGLGEFIQNLVSEPLALGRSQQAKNRLNEMIATTKTHGERQPLASVGDDLTLILDNVAVKALKAVIGATGLSAVIGSDKPCLIVGPSGVGKSTLLQTLASEYRPQTGEIRLQGGASSADWQTVDFGDRLGFLGQTVDIFDQTLADNLRLGKPDATDDELYAVLDKVNLGAWIKAQPKQLATPLGEYGMAVSGGQARRIALARLLLAPKAVMLLDEPFAGLDNTTRQIVWQNLIQAQQSKQIGLLLISTHQLWQEMGEVAVLKVGENQG
ncbi:amino acid ABC transporter ATP-binding/permease protein [Moraxella marmotae]|uniref:amino acid ABC transporter ATP-binding/permease protein n=1 Tax=Moraxella marmotae TaxID=3344520 RepID=UPI0035F33CD1